ncbi:MAG: hypothetical protein DHS20C05_01860 [Hyphococcus sp.]|nr:MAG: hypothetical protein DHS20C05_01860 [Marinicaulis sp.]
MFQGFDDEAAIGKRLRRLSDLIDQDAKRFYDTQDVLFEQRWFGVLNQLVMHGPMSVSELSKALRISHVSVSETRKSLEQAKLITSKPDKTDGRVKRLTFTKSGARLVETMQPIWLALEEASQEINREARNIVAALDRLDAVLTKKSLFERASDKLK